MNWSQQHAMIEQMSPEVLRFVLHALRGLEQENIFDAPGVISGVLGRMQAADSDVIRAATGRTERLLRAAFARRAEYRTGA